MHICGIDDWSCGLTWMEIVQALILVSCISPLFFPPFPVEREQERVMGLENGDRLLCEVLFACTA